MIWLQTGGRSILLMVAGAVERPMQRSATQAPLCLGTAAGLVA